VVVVVDKVVVVEELPSVVVVVVAANAPETATQPVARAATDTNARNFFIE
jgi:hypothetical protein